MNKKLLKKFLNNKLVQTKFIQKYNKQLIKEEFKIIEKDIYDIIKNTSNKADIRNLNSIVSKIRGFSSLLNKITPYTNKNQNKMVFISILKTMKRRHSLLDLDLKMELKE